MSKALSREGSMWIWEGSSVGVLREVMMRGRCARRAFSRAASSKSMLCWCVYLSARGAPDAASTDCTSSARVGCALSAAAAGMLNTDTCNLANASKKSAMWLQVHIVSWHALRSSQTSLSWPLLQRGPPFTGQKVKGKLGLMTGSCCIMPTENTFFLFFSLSTLGVRPGCRAYHRTARL